MNVSALYHYDSMIVDADRVPGLMNDIATVGWEPISVAYAGTFTFQKKGIQTEANDNAVTVIRFMVSARILKSIVEKIQNKEMPGNRVN